MPHTRTSRGEKTRSQIVHAAADLMHLRGVGGTSVDDVLDASGTGKSQFYHYFESKDALVLEVIKYQLSRYVDSQRPFIERLDSWKGIRTWLDAIADQYEDRRLLGGCPIGSLAAEIADRDETLRFHAAEAFDEWERYLRDGLDSMRRRSLLRRTADPAQLAETTMASIQGGYLLANTKKNIDPMRRSLDAAYAHLRSFARSPLKARQT